MRKVSKYGVFSGPYFHAFGLNTERYGVTIRIQSEYEKIRIRKNSVSGYFHAVTMSSYEAKLETLCKKSIKELTEKTIQKLFPHNRNSL